MLAAAALGGIVAGFALVVFTTRGGRRPQLRAGRTLRARPRPFLLDEPPTWGSE